MTSTIMPPAPVLTWSSAFASHVGAVRAINEDSCLDAAEFGLWAVADGMGGHEGGQIASRIVIDAIDWEPDRSSEAAVVEDITTRLAMANDRLRQISRNRFAGRTIGSTIATVLAFGPVALCLWAGDSRIYLFRRGQLRQISRDHSAVEDLIDQGLIDAEQARTHRLRNVITRAVGAHETLNVEVRREVVEDGDLWLLCTDGLNKVMTDAEIAAHLNGEDCDRIARSLVEVSLARGVPDNVTVCVVRASRPPAGPDHDDPDPTLPQQRSGAGPARR